MNRIQIAIGYIYKVRKIVNKSHIVVYTCIRLVYRHRSSSGQLDFESLLHYRVEVDSSMVRNQPTFLIASDCFREACYNSPMKCCFIKVKSSISFDWTAIRSFGICFLVYNSQENFIGKPCQQKSKS